MCDLDEDELTIVVDNIIKVSVWLSTLFEKYYFTLPLSQYCKYVKDDLGLQTDQGRSRFITINSICEYFKIHDVDPFYSYGISNDNFIESYNNDQNHFQQLWNILGPAKE